MKPAKQLEMFGGAVTVPRTGTRNETARGSARHKVPRLTAGAKQASPKVEPRPLLSGGTLSDKRDGKRLSTLLARVAFSMQAFPRWWTLRALSDATGGSEASVSARIRENGNYERRYVKNGLWEYRHKTERQSTCQSTKSG